MHFGEFGTIVLPLRPTSQGPRLGSGHCAVLPPTRTNASAPQSLAISALALWRAILTRDSRLTTHDCGSQPSGPADKNQEENWTIHRAVSPYVHHISMAPPIERSKVGSTRPPRLCGQFAAKREGLGWVECWSAPASIDARCRVDWGECVEEATAAI
jgi:hypothetical protein